MALCLGATGALGVSNELVHVVRIPGGGLQPQVAADPEGNIHLVYLKGDPKGCDVFYSIRKSGQQTFSAPIQVNTEPGSAIALGTVRGAQIAIGRKGRVHVAWNGSQPAHETGAKGAPMLYTRSETRGLRFEPQRNLMISTMNLDGGGSVAADSKGNVYVVWHAHPRNGPEDETHRAVYLARSTDDGFSFAPERKLTSEENGACACCGLKAFADDNNRVAIVYRAADEVGNRDSKLLLSLDAGTTFRSTTLGTWHSTTCPMSTPALGRGPGNDLLAVWETQGQIHARNLTPDRLASSPPSWTPEENPANRKHPVFAWSLSGGNRVLIAWVEGTGWGKGGSLAWECRDIDNNVRTSGQALGVPAWDLPAAFPDPDGTFTIVF